MVFLVAFGGLTLLTVLWILWSAFDKAIAPQLSYSQSLWNCSILQHCPLLRSPYVSAFFLFFTSFVILSIINQCDEWIQRWLAVLTILSYYLTARLIDLPCHLWSISRENKVSVVLVCINGDIFYISDTVGFCRSFVTSWDKLHISQFNYLGSSLTLMRLWELLSWWSCAYLYQLACPLSMLMLLLADTCRHGSGVRVVTFRQFFTERWAVWTHPCLVGLVAPNCCPMAPQWPMTSFNH